MGTPVPATHGRPNETNAHPHATHRVAVVHNGIIENFAELKAELARLKAENEALKAKEKRGTYLKVSEKGGVSLYGMRRFPITFYREEWERILGMADEILAFIGENESKLKKPRGEE